MGYIECHRSSRDVSPRPNLSRRVIYLVKEDILSISAFGCKIFEVSILAYTVLLTQLLPKLTSNYVRFNAHISHIPPNWVVILTAIAALASLDSDDLSISCSLDKDHAGKVSAYLGISNAGH